MQGLKIFNKNIYNIYSDDFLVTSEAYQNIYKPYIKLLRSTYFEIKKNNQNFTIKNELFFDLKLIIKKNFSWNEKFENNLKMFKIDLIAGARPNLIKLAPLLRLLKKEKNFLTTFIYTGQHYDKKLYSNNLSDLKIQKPDINLGIGSGTHNYQISEVMKKYDGFLKKIKLI